MDLKGLTTIQILTILAVANECLVAALHGIKLPKPFDDDKPKYSILSLVCGTALILFANETELLPGTELRFIQCLFYGFLIAGGRTVVTAAGAGVMRAFK